MRRRRAGWGMLAAVGFRWASGGPGRLAGRRRRRNVPPQALWTAVNERLPVTFVVINNREYNILKNFMRSQPHYTSAQTGRFVAMEINDPPIDFLARPRPWACPRNASSGPRIFVRGSARRWPRTGQPDRDRGGSGMIPKTALGRLPRKRVVVPHGNGPDGQGELVGRRRGSGCRQGMTLSGRKPTIEMRGDGVMREAWPRMHGYQCRLPACIAAIVRPSSHLAQPDSSGTCPRVSVFVGTQPSGAAHHSADAATSGRAARCSDFER